MRSGPSAPAAVLGVVRFDAVHIPDLAVLDGDHVGRDARTMTPGQRPDLAYVACARRPARGEWKSCLGSMPSSRGDQKAAVGKASRIVDPQNIDRRAPDRGKSTKRRTLPQSRIAEVDSIRTGLLRDLAPACAEIQPWISGRVWSSVASCGPWRELSRETGPRA